MTRSKDERDRNRADLLRILEEQGTTPTGDLIAQAYGVREVQTGSLHHRQGTSDLAALKRQRKVMSTWLNGWLMAWALADQRVLDELEDAADLGRQMAIAWHTCPHPEFGIPVRCKHCGARKCDRSDCLLRRHHRGPHELY